jgi:hypothetical protein
MKSNVIADLGEQYLPMPFTKFFHDQRAMPKPENNDGGMWFGDEMPPTMQDYLNSPQVRQAQAFVTWQALQQIMGQQH